MMNIVVVTSIKEQQDVMRYLTDALKSQHFTDTSIAVMQSGISKIDVYHSVSGRRNLARTYKVVLVPISLSLDGLYGYSASTNINISRVLERLDEMKKEVVHFVNSRKDQLPIVNKQKEALARAAKLLFD